MDWTEEQLGNLQERLAEMERELNEARSNYQFMVDRAAHEKLDGYRELASKCADLERQRDESEARVAEARRLAFMESVDIARRAAEQYRVDGWETIADAVHALSEQMRDFLAPPATKETAK